MSSVKKNSFEKSFGRLYDQDDKGVIDLKYFIPLSLCVIVVSSNLGLSGLSLISTFLPSTSSINFCETPLFIIPFSFQSIVIHGVKFRDINRIAALIIDTLK